MTDMELLLERLGRLAIVLDELMPGCAELVRDALALLKEQEAVVRCKDCKYGKIHGINVECIAHEEVGYDPEPWHPLDWYCADGEKSD